MVNARPVIWLISSWHFLLLISAYSTPANPYLASDPMTSLLIIPQACHRLRFRFVVPVQLRTMIIDEHRRDLWPRGLVSPSLQQQHLPLRNFRQATGHNCSTRTPADNNEVVTRDVGPLSTRDPTTRVRKVALFPQQRVQQPHEEDKGASPTSFGQRRADVGRRTVASDLWVQRTGTNSLVAEPEGQHLGSYIHSYVMTFHRRKSLWRNWTLNWWLLYCQ